MPQSHLKNHCLVCTAVRVYSDGRTHHLLFLSGCTNETNKDYSGILRYLPNLSRSCTHMAVAPTATNTEKLVIGRRNGSKWGLKLVEAKWVLDSASLCAKQDESQYLLAQSSTNQQVCNHQNVIAVYVLPVSKVDLIRELPIATSGNARFR